MRRRRSGPSSSWAEPRRSWTRRRKLAALEAIVEHVVPGRSREVRGPNANELRATTVLRLSLAEASAKVCTGPPLDDEEDYKLPAWAGVIPLRLAPEAPVADPRLPAETAVPANVAGYRR